MAEIVKVNAAELKTYDKNKFVPKVVHQSTGLKVVLAYFKKGQFKRNQNYPLQVLSSCSLQATAGVFLHAFPSRGKTYIHYCH